MTSVPTPPESGRTDEIVRCGKCDAPKGTPAPCPEYGVYTGNQHNWLAIPAPASVSGTGDSGPTDLGPWCCYADEVGMYGDGVCTPEDPRHAPTYCGYDNVRRGLVPAPPAAPPSPPERPDTAALRSVADRIIDNTGLPYGAAADLLAAADWIDAAAPVQPRGDELGVLREAAETLLREAVRVNSRLLDRSLLLAADSMHRALSASPATADRTATCGVKNGPHDSTYVCTLPSGHDGDHAQQAVIASWSAPGGLS